MSSFLEASHDLIGGNFNNDSDLSRKAFYKTGHKHKNKA